MDDSPLIVVADPNAHSRELDRLTQLLVELLTRCFAGFGFRVAR